MAAIDSANFSISAGKVIDYTGAAHGATGAVYHTTIEFHRWLMDKADDAVASGNDLLDITYDTPSDRATDNYIKLINGYTITDAVAEHLYDGSIEQGILGTSGCKIWDGQVVIAAPDMDLQIMQDGAQITNDFWNTIMFNDGGINPNGYKGLNFDTNNGISHRFMLKVYDFDADGGYIDGARYIGMTRVDASSNGGTGKTFSEFKVNGSARGNNVIALTYADDLNDASDASGLTGISNQLYGYNGIDVETGITSYYYSKWTKGANTINQLYQYIKYLSRGAAANLGTLYNIDAKIFRGITHVLNGTQATGTFGTASSSQTGQPEEITWATGTGQLLAVDDTGSATKIWMQILTGVAPSSGTVTGTTSGATFSVSSNTEFTVSSPIIGVSTGSAIIGATGFGVLSTDLSKNDKVFDLAGAPHTPPTNVTFTVTGVESGEDRILVGPESGGTFHMTQGAVATSALTTGSTTVVMTGDGTGGTEALGTGTQSEFDTPNDCTGTPTALRIMDDNGVYQRVTYTGYTASADTLTFTGCDCSALTAGAAISNDMFIAYIDALYNGTSATNAYTATYGSATRNLYVRVRDGGTGGDAEGIKTFESAASIADNNNSISAIRTPDV
jgi:hypothetical protein